MPSRHPREARFTHRMSMSLSPQQYQDLAEIADTAVIPLVSAARMVIEAGLPSVKQELGVRGGEGHDMDNGSTSAMR